MASPLPPSPPSSAKAAGETELEATPAGLETGSGANSEAQQSGLQQDGENGAKEAPQCLGGPPPPPPSPPPAGLSPGPASPSAPPPEETPHGPSGSAPEAAAGEARSFTTPTAPDNLACALHIMDQQVQISCDMSPPCVMICSPCCTLVGHAHFPLPCTPSPASHPFLALPLPLPLTPPPPAGPASLLVRHAHLIHYQPV